MYHLYLLECADGTIYTGITIDLEKRLALHKAGKGASYTRSHGAKRILYTESYPDRSTASKREYEIKKMSREQKLSLVK